MSDRSRSLPVLAVFVLLVGTTPVWAYVPGAGPEFFPMFLQLVTMVFLAVGTVLLWPFYTLMRWLRGSKPRPTARAEPRATDEPGEGVPPAVQ